MTDATREDFKRTIIERLGLPPDTSDVDLLDAMRVNGERIGKITDVVEAWFYGNDGSGLEPRYKASAVSVTLCQMMKSEEALEAVNRISRRMSELAKNPANVRRCWTWFDKLKMHVIPGYVRF